MDRHRSRLFRERGRQAQRERSKPPLGALQRRSLKRDTPRFNTDGRDRAAVSLLASGHRAREFSKKVIGGEELCAKRGFFERGRDADLFRPSRRVDEEAKVAKRGTVG